MAGRVGLTILLLTTSDEGWPQVAIFSATAPTFNFTSSGQQSPSPPIGVR